MTRVIDDIELPLEGPVRLLSLSQQLRQNTTDLYELYETFRPAPFFEEL